MKGFGKIVGVALIGISSVSFSFAQSSTPSWKAGMDGLVNLITSRLSEQIIAFETDKIGGKENFALREKVVVSDERKKIQKDSLDDFITRYQIGTSQITMPYEDIRIDMSSPVRYFSSKLKAELLKKFLAMEIQKAGGEENFKQALAVYKSPEYIEATKQSLLAVQNQKNEQDGRTDRMNRDDPTGEGDFETYAEFVKDGKTVCPTGKSAIRADYEPKNRLGYIQFIGNPTAAQSYHNLDEVTAKNILGVACWNNAKSQCQDYKIRFYCE